MPVEFACFPALFHRTTQLSHIKSPFVNLLCHIFSSLDALHKCPPSFPHIFWLTFGLLSTFPLFPLFLQIFALNKFVSKLPYFTILSLNFVKSFPHISTNQFLIFGLKTRFLGFFHNRNYYYIYTRTRA